MTTDEEVLADIDLRTLVEGVETADDDLTFTVGEAANGNVWLLADGNPAAVAG